MFFKIYNKLQLMCTSSLFQNKTAKQSYRSLKIYIMLYSLILLFKICIINVSLTALSKIKQQNM